MKATLEEKLEKFAINSTISPYFEEENVALFKKVFKKLNYAINILPENKEEAINIFAKNYKKLIDKDEEIKSIAEWYKEEGRIEYAEHWENKAYLESTFEKVINVLDEYSQVVVDPYKKFDSNKKLLFDIVKDKTPITNNIPNAYKFDDGESETLLRLLDLDIALGKIEAKKYGVGYIPKEEEYVLKGKFKDKGSVFIGRITGKSVSYSQEEINSVKSFVDAVKDLYNEIKKEN